MRAVIIGLLIIGLLIPFVALRRQTGAGGGDGDLATAQSVLAESREAYRAAPMLLDKITMAAVSPRQSPREMLEIEIDGADRIRMSAPGFAITAVEDFVYVDRTDVTDKYLKTGPHADAVTGMGATLTQLFGDRAALPLPIAMRDGSLDEAAVLRAISMGTIAAPSLAAYERAEGADGRTVHELRIGDAGSDSHVDFTIDDETKLVTSVMVTKAATAQIPVEQVSEFSFETRIVESLPEPVDFITEGRTAVSQAQDLRPTPVGAGQVAPDFTLSTLDGAEVTLSDLRGSVVVLDFWATWCGPCRKGLPLLSKFNDWVNETGQPVKVFGVNTMERMALEQRMSKVGDYWSSQGFSMPTLVDLDVSVARKFSVNSIPATFIIGPDGRITASHIGFSQSMVELLQRDVEQAMGGAG